MARQEEAEIAAAHNTARIERESMEPLPSPEDLHNGRGGLDQNKFAKWLISSNDYHFISLNDTAEMMYYDNGVYKPGGERIINEMIVKTMDGEKVTISKGKEITYLVRTRTGHDRDEMDADHDLINLVNGLYDLKSGKLLDHTSQYMSAKQMNVEYNPEASCPNIDKFLHEIVSPEDVQFIYELFGYSLMSQKRYSTAVFFEGNGANGKSVLMELMQRFVGKDASSQITPNEMGGDDKFAIAELFGKALNVVDDLGNDVVDGVGAFKSVITGNSVRGQHKYGHAFTFVPNTLCVFGCNEVPMTTDTSEGYFRRMRIVNFPNKFEGAADNKNLIDELTTNDEISGLFNIAVAAFRDVVKRGEFVGNMTVEEKRREYLTKSNRMLMFVYDECDTNDPDNTILKDELFNQYVLWSRDHVYETKDMSSLTKTLKSIGVTVSRIQVDGDRQSYYKGIQMNQVSKSCLQIDKDDDTKLAAIPVPYLMPTPITAAVDTISPICHTSPPYCSLEEVVTYNIENAGGGMAEESNPPTVIENGIGTSRAAGMARDQSQQKESGYADKKNIDIDIDSKLKHAVGKAISKSETMGAEISTITECYPGSISTTDIREILEERGKSLGFKERYGKWYV